MTVRQTANPRARADTASRAAHNPSDPQRRSGDIPDRVVGPSQPWQRAPHFWAPPWRRRMRGRPRQPSHCLATPARTQPCPDKIWRMTAELATNLVESGPDSTEIDCIGPTCGPKWPGLTNSCGRARVSCGVIVCARDPADVRYVLISGARRRRQTSQPVPVDRPSLSFVSHLVVCRVPLPDARSSVGVRHLVVCRASCRQLLTL